jgi:hypothetical protein
MKPMNISNTALQGQERRRFFRIDDDINLYYKIIDANAVKPANQVSEDMLNGCSLSIAWHILSQEAKVMQPRVETKDAEIAEYFRILNAKLDLIAQAFVLQDVEESEQKNRNVNLSASGLAFDNHEALQIGDHLEVRMVLGSIVAVILLQAKVVYCKNNAQDHPSKLPYLIGLEYENIQEQDRETLIQYILQRQKRQIRESKEAALMEAWR